MRRLVPLALLVLVFAPPRCGLSPVRAAARPTLAVGAIREGLLDAIERLHAVAAARSRQARPAWSSLEANARRVVTDIDIRLSGRLDEAVDRLDATERRLMANAQELAGRIDAAAAALTDRETSAARELVGEADILAFDTIHSLPCRSQPPRVVYVTPGEVHAGAGLAEVRLRGNHLAFGADPEVRVDGRPALLLARNGSELRIQVPPALLGSLEESQAVAIRFRPAAKRRVCYLWGLLPWSSVAPLAHDLTAFVVLRPGVAPGGPGRAED